MRSVPVYHCFRTFTLPFTTSLCAITSLARPVTSTAPTEVLPVLPDLYPSPLSIPYPHYSLSSPVQTSAELQRSSPRFTDLWFVCYCSYSVGVSSPSLSLIYCTVCSRYNREPPPPFHPKSLGPSPSFPLVLSPSSVQPSVLSKTIKTSRRLPLSLVSL